MYAYILLQREYCKEYTQGDEGIKLYGIQTETLNFINQ